MIEKIKVEPFRRYQKWKKGWKDFPLFVIILGGFRWDYLEAFKPEVFTAFEYLKKHGSSIPLVDPVFPTEDYPVWTSLSTGGYSLFRNKRFALNKMFQ